MEIAIQIMGWVRLILILLAAGYSVQALKVLTYSKKKNKIFNIKRQTFFLLAGATVLFALGLFVLNILELLSATNFPSIADIPLVISHILFIVSFVYFWVKTSKLHKLHIKEPIFFFGVVCAILIWLIFLFRLSVIPVTTGTYWLALILYWAYPILVALMFVSTLIINPLLKSEVITTPLWYLSIAIFLHFIAFMIHYYSSLNEMYLYVSAIYSLLYVFSAGFFVIGFYTATKKYK